MATYRVTDTGEYQLFSPLMGWFDAPAGWTPDGEPKSTDSPATDPPEEDYPDPNDIILGHMGATGKDPYEPYDPSDVAITGNDYTYTSGGAYNNTTDPDQTNPLTLDQVAAERDLTTANEWIDKFAGIGATATYDPTTGYYTVTAADGSKYRANSPVSIWEDAWAAAGLPPTTDNPWYEGADGPDGVPGPLVVTPDYPDGGPMPGGPHTPGSAMYPVLHPEMPQDPGSSIYGSLFNRIRRWAENWDDPDRFGRVDSPVDTTPPPPSGGGSTGPGGYTPPPGIPLNPIVSENPMMFSPYGIPAAQYSNIATFGGLPRSTGPWATPGGYYGGNPYADVPPGYLPSQLPGSPNPGGSMDSPFNPNPVGGTYPPGESPWFPPAQRIIFNPETGQYEYADGSPAGANPTGSSTGIGMTGL